MEEHLEKYRELYKIPENIITTTKYQLELYQNEMISKTINALHNISRYIKKTSDIDDKKTIELAYYFYLKKVADRLNAELPIKLEEFENILQDIRIDVSLDLNDIINLSL